jgi:hypothetical protein
MTFQNSPITIVSDNVKYPQNKVTVITETDLNPNNTIVIADTSFPYIVQFDNCAAAVGKRYISEYLYNFLTNQTSGKYKTNRGKISYTLEKDLSPFPYLTLDYSLFIDRVSKIRAESIVEQDETISNLDYVGASIQSFEEISPEFLLQWLNLPLTDERGESIKSFPSLLSYSNKRNLEVRIEIIERKNRFDFFNNIYFVSILYPNDDSSLKNANENFDKYKYTLGSGIFSGPNSKSFKYDKLINLRKGKSINDILNNASNIKKSILGLASLLSSAALLKSKLSAAQELLKKESLPKISIKFNKTLVTAKIKKAEQKAKKKKRLSGKKAKPTIESPELKNPKVESLKKLAGGLTASTSALKATATNKSKEVANKIGTTIS